jgi:hypothetical protein
MYRPIVPAQARELPEPCALMEMLKVAALLGLGWTDFKLSSLNRLNSTGPTRKPMQPMGAVREMPFALAVGRPRKRATAHGY